jgi:hypothetical protein
VKAGHPKDAIDMYTKANMYEAAHKVIFTDFTFSLITSMHQASWAFTRVSFSYFFQLHFIENGFLFCTVDSDMHGAR